MITQRFGRILYILLFPLLFLYLRLNARTRVLIKKNDEILLVKPWLGNGGWDLPGGGLHINERPSVGAAREVFEETGIKINDKELQKLGLISRGLILPSRAHCFVISLNKPPVIKKQFVEINDIAWVKIDQLDSFRIHPLSKEAIDLWRRSLSS